MQTSGNTMEFNVTQTCMLPAGIPEDEHLDRMPQYSLGFQVPVYSETSAARSYECMPIESGRIDAEYLNKIMEQRRLMFTEFRSTGVCVASMNPRKRLADGTMTHTVTWGYGGFQRMRYYWSGLDVTAGDYVGYAFEIAMDAGKIDSVTKKALVFKQTKGVCNRGLTRAEPKSWINIYLQHYAKETGESTIPDGTFVYIVSVGQITETMRCLDYEKPISKDIKLPLPERPVGVIVNMQDMWFGPGSADYPPATKDLAIMSPDSTIPVFTRHARGRVYDELEIESLQGCYPAKRRVTEDLGDYGEMMETDTPFEFRNAPSFNYIPPTLSNGRSVFRFDGGVGTYDPKMDARNILVGGAAENIAARGDAHVDGSYSVRWCKPNSVVSVPTIRTPSPPPPPQPDYNYEGYDYAANGRHLKINELFQQLLLQAGGINSFVISKNTNPIAVNAEYEQKQLFQYLKDSDAIATTPKDNSYELTHRNANNDGDDTIYIDWRFAILARLNPAGEIFATVADYWARIGMGTRPVPQDAIDWFTASVSHNSTPADNNNHRTIFPLDVFKGASGDLFTFNKGGIKMLGPVSNKPDLKLPSGGGSGPGSAPVQFDYGNGYDYNQNTNNYDIRAMFNQLVGLNGNVNTFVIARNSDAEVVNSEDDQKAFFTYLAQNNAIKNGNEHGHAIILHRNSAGTAAEEISVDLHFARFRQIPVSGIIYESADAFWDYIDAAGKYGPIPASVSTWFQTSIANNGAAANVIPIFPIDVFGNSLDYFMFEQGLSKVAGPSTNTLMISTADAASVFANVLDTEDEKARILTDIVTALHMLEVQVPVNNGVKAYRSISSKSKAAIFTRMKDNAALRFDGNNSAFGEVNVVIDGTNRKVGVDARYIYMRVPTASMYQDYEGLAHAFNIRLESIEKQTVAGIFADNACSNAHEFTIVDAFTKPGKYVKGVQNTTTIYL